jgi:hypothetical protein
VASDEVGCLIGGMRVRVRWPGRDEASVAALVGDYERVAIDPDHATWSIVLTDPGESPHIEADIHARELRVRRDAGTPPAEALQHAAARALLCEGRLPIHGAVLARTRTAPGTLFLGESGSGKSSLALLAISKGWRVVSDDLTALHHVGDAGVVAAAVRWRLRIAAHLLDAETRARGRKFVSGTGLRKIRLDPNALRPESFLGQARIGRLVFLERGDVRAITTISPSEALARLLSVCAPALSLEGGRGYAGLLSGLVRQADAKVVRLTQTCLSDPEVLGDLAA